MVPVQNHLLRLRGLGSTHRCPRVETRLSISCSLCRTGCWQFVTMVRTRLPESGAVLGSNQPMVEVRPGMTWVISNRAKLHYIMRAWVRDRLKPPKLSSRVTSTGVSLGEMAELLR